MKLKEIRLNNNKTQQQVSNALGLTQNTYSNYENGKTQPDFQTLVKFADYFHVTIDELLGHEVPYTLNRVEFSEKQLKIIEKIKMLNNSQSDKVDAFIMGLLEADNIKKP